MPDYPIPIARAEVQRSGDWTPHAEPHVETSLPLNIPVPGALQPARRPASSPPPPRPPPTEAELRARLAEANDARRAAADALQRAQAVAERAERQRDRCANALRGFTRLDAEIKEATIAQLRDDAPRVIPDHLWQRLSERDVAKAELAAAEGAATELGAERDRARVGANIAAKDARAAALAVLAVRAMRIAKQHDAILAEAERMRLALWGFDRIATRETMPAAVLNLLRQHDVSVTAMARANVGEWQAALAALLEDAQAEVVIDA